jgi:hypothetical protein
MTSDDDSLPPNYQSKIRQISKLKQDLVEREDECMFWYRQFHDAKEARSKGSAKTPKHRHNYLKKR